jgi:glutamate synthase (NADPH/NADH) large chain
VTLRLLGDANDHVGKGLSGGRIVVRPDPAAPFAAEDNVVAGNVLAYGATAGELYVRGVAGERFAVRNSGAVAVVEGVGDHACEYMTGGRVVILGRTGRNLAAGMSGGLAWVLDLDPAAVNPAMVDLEPVSADDAAALHATVACHRDETGSPVAAALLADWPAALGRFTAVVPRDYKRVLEATRRAEADGRPVDEAIMEAARG